MHTTTRDDAHRAMLAHGATVVATIRDALGLDALTGDDTRDAFPVWSATEKNIGTCMVHYFDAPHTTATCEKFAAVLRAAGHHVDYAGGGYGYIIATDYPRGDGITY